LTGGTQGYPLTFIAQFKRHGSGTPAGVENENKSARILPGRTPLAPRDTWFNTHHAEEETSMLSTILLIILILLLLGALPAWPYSRGWGYGPSGLTLVLVVILVVLLATGRI
jgi:hypothetical protein